jgi:hypothetical protein
VDWLVAVQAQDYAAKWSLGLRLGQGSDALHERVSSARLLKATR